MCKGIGGREIDSSDDEGYGSVDLSNELEDIFHSSKFKYGSARQPFNHVLLSGPDLLLRLAESFVIHVQVLKAKQIKYSDRKRRRLYCIYIWGLCLYMEYPDLQYFLFLYRLETRR